MAAKILNLNGPSLVSRAAAAKKRLQIESIAAGNRKVALCFSEVTSVSPSYGDELLGVLFAKHGIEWVSENIELLDVSESVLEDLAAALHEGEGLRESSSHLSEAL